MLKNILLHIEKDDNLQAELEKKLAEHVNRVQKDNVNVFQRNIPSLVPLISTIKSHNLSIFCNKNGHFNIVDYGLGQVFYGLHPLEEIAAQIAQFRRHSQYVCLHSSHRNVDPTTAADLPEQLLRDIPKVRELISRPPLPPRVDCLVLLGLGLGHHIAPLMDACAPKCVIIYEPEEQHFAASSLVLEWRQVFDQIKANDTALFLQLGKDGRDLVSDIEELNTQFPINGFYLYQHYNHPIFDTLTSQLAQHSWKGIQQTGFAFAMEDDPNAFCQTFSEASSFLDYSPLVKDNPLFQQNMTAFQQFFPEIAAQFANYTPKIWVPLLTRDGEVNIINKRNLVCWYGDSPKSDCDRNFRGFSDFPNKDGLVLGYNGNKLSHYLHYQFVKQTTSILDEVEEEVGALPDNIQSLILFGLGVGYQLENLLENHTVEHLFLCEPNPDFFYASMFAVNWNTIIDKMNKEKAKFYINIGDDGTNLFRDLLSQFYAIGPYILNNTYFYQSYYNAALNLAVAKLREQLQVVISMGEYFDHARYGIAHTQEGLKRGLPALIAHPDKSLSYQDKEVPIFIVGNGPSLDQCFEAISAWRDKAIIVSCGTALQSLQRHGIVPDFHAEIEQHRSTFEWACMVDDRDFLKQITLVSCNGIHPDTTELYKDVLIAYKEGESSTVSTLEVIGKDKYSTLQYAFPTVANFACDLFTKLGFFNIYLLGIDMGFINQDRHHSKYSGYYQENGTQLYNYSRNQNVSLVVPGNFRQSVHTKHEFKIAKLVMEQCIAVTAKTTHYYNCSDGARITGSEPLKIENILITASSKQKQDAISGLKSNAFRVESKTRIIEQYLNRYDSKILAKELEVFHSWLNKPVGDFDDAVNRIDQQKNLLFLSYKNGHSLLFYYLYGTVNYANAMLTKLLYSSKTNGLVQFQKGLQVWEKFFSTLRENITCQHQGFDASSSPYPPELLAKTVLKNHLKHKTIGFISNSAAHSSVFKHVADDFFNSASITYSDVDLKQGQGADIENPLDYVVYWDNDALEDHLTATSELPVMGRKNTLVVTRNWDRAALLNFSRRYQSPVTLLCFSDQGTAFGEENVYRPPLIVANEILTAVCEHKYHLIFPRYNFVKTAPETSLFTTSKWLLTEFSDSDTVFKNKYFMLVDLLGERGGTGRLTNGFYCQPIVHSEPQSDNFFKLIATGEITYQNWVKKSLTLAPNLFDETTLKSPCLTVLEIV